VTLKELIRRATSGLKLERHSLFRPSLAYELLRDPFWVWCEYNAPPSEAVDETGRYDEMRLQRGIDYEQAWVGKHHPEAVRIEPAFGLEALRNTLQAMLEGCPAIYQPQLWDLGGETYGRGDLLVRDNSHRSDLGLYHYRVVEIKRSGSLQDYHTVQGALYNRMVGKIQGFLTPEMTIALRDTVEQVPYAAVESALDDVLLTWQALCDGAPSLSLAGPRRPRAALASMGIGCRAQEGSHPAGRDRNTRGRSSRGRDSQPGSALGS
jgi:hypothetical protein